MARKDGGVVIVGPSKAGKTSLLGALSLAARRSVRSTRGYRSWLDPLNKEMETLIQRANETVDSDGAIPFQGSVGISEYEFRMGVNLNTNWYEEAMCFLYPYLFRGTRSETVSVVDSPGGVILPQPRQGAALNKAQVEGMKQLLHDRTEKANGLLLCLDSADLDPDTATSLMKELQQFIMQVTRRRKLPRVAIALTKADLCFYSETHKAREKVEEADPWEHVGNLIDEATLDQLADRSERLAIGWVSVYGFTENGRPNYDQDRNRMISFIEEKNQAKRINSWKPFRLLDPMVYLLTGELGTLKRYPG